MTFDRESAQAAGVKVGRLDTLLMVLTAVTIVLGMKVAGILLVAALIVIPGRGRAPGRRELSGWPSRASTAVAVVSVARGSRASRSLSTSPRRPRSSPLFFRLRGLFAREERPGGPARYRIASGRRPVQGPGDVWP